MKNRSLTICLTGALFLIGVVAGAQGQTAGKSPVPAETVSAPRLSVFEEPLRPPYSDPFFPQSKRMPYNAAPVVAPTTQPQLATVDQIILKGVTIGAGGKRLAIINRKTFAAGEAGTVQTPRGPVNIEVLEVSDRSVKLKVENDPEPKEIYLGPEP